MFTSLLRSSRRTAQLLLKSASGSQYVVACRLGDVARVAAQRNRSSAPWFFGLAAAAGASAASHFAHGDAKEAGEQSFIMVKPDGVHRGLVAEIIKRFESKGYKLVGIKVVVPSEELASKHYDEHNGKPFFPKLVQFLSSGPCVAMVWEGTDVVTYGRKMIGATSPSASAPGTIRGDFAIEMGRNLIHGSDSVESAQKEIALWFSVKELVQYTPCSTPWMYE